MTLLLLCRRRLVALLYQCSDGYCPGYLCDSVILRSSQARQCEPLQSEIEIKWKSGPPKTIRAGACAFGNDGDGNACGSSAISIIIANVSCLGWKSTILRPAGWIFRVVSDWFASELPCIDTRASAIRLPCSRWCRSAAFRTQELRNIYDAERRRLGALAFLWRRRSVLRLGMSLQALQLLQSISAFVAGMNQLIVVSISSRELAHTASWPHFEQTSMSLTLTRHSFPPSPRHDFSTRTPHPLHMRRFTARTRLWFTLMWYASVGSTIARIMAVTIVSQHAMTIFRGSSCHANAAARQVSAPL